MKSKAGTRYKSRIYRISYKSQQVERGRVEKRPLSSLYPVCLTHSCKTTVTVKLKSQSGFFPETTHFRSSGGLPVDFSSLVRISDETLLCSCCYVAKYVIMSTCSHYKHNRSFYVEMLFMTMTLCRYVASVNQASVSVWHCFLIFSP